MEDVNISIYRASVVREGSTPASPGFVVSDGQNPVDPSGSGQNHLPVTIAEAATGLSITESQVLGGAGTVGQYIRGDGSLADFPESSGGGSSVSYYLNGSVSQGTIGGVAYKELNKVPILGAGTDFTINADGYIASFITDAGDPNLLEIPGGNWNFETYFSASSGGGSPSFYVELYKVNSGGTATLLASNSTFPELIAFGTNITAYFSTLAVPTTTLALTDRLAIRYYVTHSGRTITLHTEDNHLCQIVTTFTTGLTALNGLTAQIQNFAVGTSGTDFAIASATATHTFNLPTASATNRGALSSADWSIFNGKQNALTNPVTGTGTTNYLPKFTGTSTIGNSNIQDSGTLVTVGVASTFSSTLYVNSTATIAYSALSSDFGAGYTVGLGVGYSSAVSKGINMGWNTTLDMGFIGAVHNGTTWKNLILCPALGNVLIGAASDNGARLQVSSTGVAFNFTTSNGLIGNINSSDANGGYLTWQTSGTIIADLGTAQQVFGTGGNDTFGINARGSRSLILGTNNTARFTIASTGAATFTNKVGTGGAAATYSLTAYNASNGTTVAFGGTAKGIRIDNDGTFSLGRSTIFGVDSSFYGSYQPLSIEASSLALQAISGGNVVIGDTSDPGYKLFINGNTYIKGIDSTSASFALVVQNSSASNLFLVRNDGILSASSLALSGTIANSGDAATLTIKQASTTFTNGIYLERAGERNGYYMYIGGGLDALTFRRNYFGTQSDVLSLNRDGTSSFSSSVSAASCSLSGTIASGNYSQSGDFGAGFTITGAIGISGKGINMGWNTTTDVGFIGTVHNGTAWKSLSLVPLAGSLLIGTPTNGASKLRIVGLPTSAVGLSSGDVYNLSGVLMIA